MSMASRAILSNFFEEQWAQNHPQYPSGLSRALFPTTFLEIAVYWVKTPTHPLLSFLFVGQLLRRFVASVMGGREGGGGGEEMNFER